VAKLFTREEAEALLPRIIPILEELRVLAQQLEAYERELATLQLHARGNGRTSNDEMERKQTELDQLRARIHSKVLEVHELGAEVKDLRMGLIDFPSLLDGRTVYLCWKLGETGIAFWHELDAGYAGRQSL
jgi:hypothetical protein